MTELRPFPAELLIIGTTSLVGSRFVEQLGGISQFYGANRQKPASPLLKNGWGMDVTDAGSVLNVIKEYPGQYILNFAGFTDVGAAEKMRPQNPLDQQSLNDNPAYQLNVVATKNIIAACQQTGKFPIFLSTDFVFDGKIGPYREQDLRASNSNDINWYGWTKLLAELETEKLGLDYLMIRIAYPYRKDFSGKGDFGRDMLTKAATRAADGTVTFNYPLFTDQKLTPTFIDDLAPALTALIEKGQKGIYHLASPEIVSPFDFGCEIYRVAWGMKDPENLIEKGDLEEILLNGGTKKPLHGGLKVEKLIHDAGFTPTDWKTGIKLAYSPGKVDWN
jgi:dTDP-4-dehydrorhamnose reductase